MGSQTRSTRILLLAVGVLVVAVAVYTIAGRLASGSRLERAKSLYEGGDEKGAYRLFEDIYNRQPRSRSGTEALYYLCRMSKGPADERIECWKKFLEDAPPGEAGFVGMLELAGLYHENGEDEKAIHAYKDVIQNAPQAGQIVRAMYEMASLCREGGRQEEARDTLRSILEDRPDTPLVGKVQKDLGEVNIEMLLTRRVYEPLSFEYVVKQGDSLEGIAKKFNTTVDFLKRCNNKENGTIRVNDRLKVTDADFSILIDKSQCTLFLLAGGDHFKIYSVGTGKDNVTPVGEFKIVNKIVEPVWYKPGGGEIPYGHSDNLLGTRWMGVDSPGYGIHGTWQPETVGKQSSAGCVRLLNEDVEEIFMLVPVGTKVTIVD